MSIQDTWYHDVSWTLFLLSAGHPSHLLAFNSPGLKLIELTRPEVVASASLPQNAGALPVIFDRLVRGCPDLYGETKKYRIGQNRSGHDWSVVLSKKSDSW